MRDASVGVLPHEVALAVAVEIGYLHHTPAGAGADDFGGGGGRDAVHLPDRRATVHVLPEDIVEAIAIHVLRLVRREESAERDGGVDAHLSVERRLGVLAVLLEIGSEALHAAVEVVDRLLHHESAADLAASPAVAGEIEARKRRCRKYRRRLVGAHRQGSAVRGGEVQIEPMTVDAGEAELKAIVVVAARGELVRRREEKVGLPLSDVVPCTAAKPQPRERTSLRIGVQRVDRVQSAHAQSGLAQAPRDG